MKRFNLSAGRSAIRTYSVPVVALVPPASSPTTARRAEDPFFTVKWERLAMAPAPPPRSADPGRRPHEKKLQTAYFERCRPIQSRRFGDAGTSGITRRGRAVIVLSAAQEARRRARPASGQSARPRHDESALGMLSLYKTSDGATMRN